MILPEAAVKAASKAMYDFNVNAARDQIDAIVYDSAQLVDIFSRVTKESQTSQVLVTSSFFEDQFETLIRRHLKRLHSKNEENEIFGPNGFLYSFGSQISFTYHLGWISSSTREALSHYKAIRNEFAHGAYRASFSDRKLSGHLSFLFKSAESFIESVVPKLSGYREVEKIRKFDQLSIDEQTLCGFVMVIYASIADLLINPVAITNNVHPRDIIDTSSSKPKNIIDLIENAIKSMLVVIENVDAKC